MVSGYVDGKGKGVGLTRSERGISVGETVVVNGGGVIVENEVQRDVQATFPYFTAESVGDAMLAQVVVVWFWTKNARSLKGGA